jgi:ribonuclease HII
MASRFSIPAFTSSAAVRSKATAKQQMLKQLICTDAPEQALRYHGFVRIAGVDEVGRGALFGPVVAAAVILPVRTASLARMGLKDSKRAAGPPHPQARPGGRRGRGVGGRDRPREHLSGLAAGDAPGCRAAVPRAGPPAYRRHADRPSLRSDAALLWRRALVVDRSRLGGRQGTSRRPLPRTRRGVPALRLAAHKGYATPQHRKALTEHGPCELHRRSFAPVAKADPEAALEEAIEAGDLFFDDDLGAPVLDPEAWGGEANA